MNGRVEKALAGQSSMLAGPHQPTLRENLEEQLRSAQANVSRLSEALSLLDSNPEVGRILELLGRSY